MHNKHIQGVVIYTVKSVMNITVKKGGTSLLYEDNCKNSTEIGRCELICLTRTKMSYYDPI